MKIDKFLDKLRGTKKPYALGIDEWSKWERNASEKNPIRFWLVEVFFPAVEDVFKWPIRRLYNLKYYVVNRWIDQSHGLMAHRKHIKPGRWADFDTRILYCLFDELVDFVEIEKAYSNFRWDSKKKKNKKWWQVGRWRTRTWRTPKDGIEYLNWEASLSENQEITAQAKAAKEILFLYDWWVNIRPNRPDPLEESGWSALCEEHRTEDGFLKNILNLDKSVTIPIHEKMNEMEEKYDKEDTEMLIRLIKIRKHLWT